MENSACRSRPQQLHAAVRHLPPFEYVCFRVSQCFEENWIRRGKWWNHMADFHRHMEPSGRAGGRRRWNSTWAAWQRYRPSDRQQSSHQLAYIVLIRWLHASVLCHRRWWSMLASSMQTKQTNLTTNLGGTASQSHECWKEFILFASRVDHRLGISRPYRIPVEHENGRWGCL